MTVEVVRDRAAEDQVVATWVGRLSPDARNGDGPALALLDPRGPVQSARAGSHVVVFDGVLYNRAELEAALGMHADAADDATLVLEGYKRWGVDVLQRIKGIFALVAWDGDRRAALLARDPLGFYPLFYAVRGDELLASTSIDALLGCDGVTAALNRSALADHLCHRWPYRDETYFEAIKRVPACHALLVEGGERRLHRYWDPAPPGEEMDWVGEAELENFHDLFDQAVKRCLTLGPTGIFLSGGLDSVSVAGVAIDHCRTEGLPEPLAMSVVFPDPDCNEELAQRAVARSLGLDQILVNLDEVVRETGLLLSSCLNQAGRSAPMLNYYWAPYLQLAEEARARGYRTIITGNGGDEWLTVTPVYAADLIRSGDVRGLLANVRSIRRSFDLSAPRVWHNALWRFGAKPLLTQAAGSTLRRFAPSLLEAHRRRVVRDGRVDWIAPDRGLRDEIDRRNVEAWPERPTDGWYRWELRRGLDHAIVGMEMEENFENMRLTGVRTLAPFQDADLVHFLYRVPPELLERGGRSKGLVRENLARRFPDLGFERHKKISALKFARNVGLTQGERAWKELGGVTALAELGVVDSEAFERELRTIVGGREMEAYRIWDVLNLESWTRTRI